jgi:hypothetical protein
MNIFTKLRSSAQSRDPGKASDNLIAAGNSLPISHAMIPSCMTAREHEYFVYIMASLSGTLYTRHHRYSLQPCDGTQSKAKSRASPVNTNAIAWFITSVLRM